MSSGHDEKCWGIVSGRKACLETEGVRDGHIDSLNPCKQCVASGFAVTGRGGGQAFPTTPD